MIFDAVSKLYSVAKWQHAEVDVTDQSVVLKPQIEKISIVHSPDRLDIVIQGAPSIYNFLLNYRSFIT